VKRSGLEKKKSKTIYENLKEIYANNILIKPFSFDNYLCYIISGQDEGIKKKIVDKIKNKKKDFSSIFLDFSEIKIEEFRKEVENLSFFNTKKMFIINNVDFSKKLFSSLMKVIEKDLDNCYVFLSQKKLEIKGNFYFDKKCIYIKVYPLTNYDAIKYIMRELKRHKIDIRYDFAALLVDGLGTAINKLDYAINRIVEYYKENGKIDEDILHNILISEKEVEIYRIIEKLFSGDEFEIKRYIENKDISENPSQFISSITMQIERYLSLKGLLEKGEQLEKALKLVGIPIFKKEIAKKILKNISYKKSKKILSYLFEMDKKIKLGIMQYSEKVFYPYIISKLYLFK